MTVLRIPDQEPFPPTQSFPARGGISAFPNRPHLAAYWVNPRAIQVYLHVE
ncbi:MAG: hypothetical protein LBD79_07095 [Treponema sp.]|nr:hypothetical protein [Treponema sp.]